MLTGIAGIAAGALSMAAGEYVSVSSQRDSEKALIDQETHEIKHFPDEEREELVSLYEAKGLQSSTARLVADELTAHDALGAHLDAEHRLDPDDLTNPWHASIASAAAFLTGAIVPLLAVMIPPPSLRVPVTFLAVIVALVITGTVSAHVGGASKKHATIRVVLGGFIAMLVTFGIGKLVGVSGI
jgi:VIT1/CCC1 family predicted Fe2+/Mn2+ transporter